MQINCILEIHNKSIKMQTNEKLMVCNVKSIMCMFFKTCVCPWIQHDCKWLSLDIRHIYCCIHVWLVCLDKYKYVTYYSQCMWKLIRMLPDIINDVKLDKILLDCHLFLEAFPSNTWKSRPTDMPLRTIKTLLNSLGKLRGAKVSIVHWMNLIEFCQ